jgi:hypothetical protein
MVTPAGFPKFGTVYTNLGRAPPTSSCLELLDDHPVVVEVHLQVSRLVRAERAQRADVRRRLDHDLVPRVDEDLRHEVEPLAARRS